jgi:hypothetical protein
VRDWSVPRTRALPPEMTAMRGDGMTVTVAVAVLVRLPGPVRYRDDGPFVSFQGLGAPRTLYPRTYLSRWL